MAGILHALPESSTSSRTPAQEVRDAAEASGPADRSRLGTISGTLRAAFTTDLLRLAQKAIQLQDEIRATHLACEHDTFIDHVGREYDAATMKPSERIRHWAFKASDREQPRQTDQADVVLSPAAFGLAAVKIVPKQQDRGSETRWRVVVKSRAIVGEVTLVR